MLVPGYASFVCIPFPVHYVAYLDGLTLEITIIYLWSSWLPTEAEFNVPLDSENRDSRFIISSFDMAG